MNGGWMTMEWIDEWWMVDWWQGDEHINKWMVDGLQWD